MGATISEAAAQAAEVSSREETERQRSVGEFVREAWSQALVAVNATEEEVQKILGKVTSWVELRPDEARRLGQELSERLRRERDVLEQSVESAVQKALTPFRIPTRDEIQTLQARLAALETRIDAALARRAAASLPQ